MSAGHLGAVLLSLTLFNALLWAVDEAHAQSPASAVDDQGETPPESEQPIEEGETGAREGDDDALDFGDDALDFGDDALDFGDDALDFGDDASAESNSGKEESSGASGKAAKVRFSLRGFVRSDTALWSERLTEEALAKARQSLDLVARFKWDRVRILAAVHGEYDFAYLHRRERFTKQTLDTYEYNINSREAQIALSFGEVELTLGRQIVAWGEGDMLSPLDVVNPRDLREPGQADLADIRLPVLATRFGWFAGDHRLELMWVHENEFGYLSPPGGPYSSFDALLSGGLGGDCSIFDVGALLASTELGLGHRQERFSLEGQEGYARWVYKGPGIDLGVYAASLLDPQGVFGITAEELLALSSSPGDAVELLLDHPRYHMVGTSGALAWDAWIFKWEASLDIRRALNVTAPTVLFPGCELSLPAVSQHEILNLMMGVSWSGVTNLQVGLEVLKPIIFDAPNDLLYDPSVFNIAMRMSYTTSDEKLSMNSVLVMQGDERGFSFTARADVAYTIVDGFKANIGYVTYVPGPTLGPFTGLDRHDRLLFGLRYDFRLYATTGS